MACVAACAGFVSINPLAGQTPQFSLPLSIGANQTITYLPNPNGDRIPDFSTVGWNYGNTPLPDAPGGYQVPVVVTLSPGSGDQTDRIQAAIDFISARPLVNGFRGALLLKAGRWDVHSINRLVVRTSGVVIRGEGDHPLTGTRVYARGTINENGGSTLPRAPLLTFLGSSNSVNATARTLVDAVYVPTGTNVIPVTGHAFTVGQRIQVRWPGSVAWQKASLFKTDATTDLDPAVTANRVITAVTPNSITLDAPITTPLDPAWGRGYIVRVTAFNNITNVGVSNIYFESTYAHDTDETHAANAVFFNHVEDGFVHNCTARYFSYSIAFVSNNTRKITVNRSQYLDGISRLIGARRYSFLLSGELGLVSNAISRYGRHSFVSSWPAVPGPVVFVDGVGIGSYNESGAHLDWNNGGLWDNITDGILQVKLERPAASSVAWNCVVGTLTFENMPFTPNWSFGTTNSSGGAPTWRNSLSTGSFAYAAPHIDKAEQWFRGTRMPVRSLYENQLNTRLAAARNPHRYEADPPERINYPPIFRTPDQLHASSGTAWSYQLPVSNIVPATRSPNFAVTGLPAGVSVNATTGLISGTLPAVATDTNFNLTLSARNIDGTTTKPMTLTVRPTGAPKIPLAMALEVDPNRTITIDVRGQGASPVPMVPASRQLAPMIVRKSYISDFDNSTVYTASDVPVPVRGVLPVEGLTSPITVTYNGSAELPTAPGFYSVNATLDDPVYSASAAGQLLITTGNAVTVTLNNTNNATAANPVTATSTQPSIPPVITYDGSPAFPTTPGQYAAKAVVADPTFFGSRLALISVGRANATLTLGNLTRTYTGAVQNPTVTTNPPGLATRVSIHGQGILPGTYPITAWIDDPAYASTPVAGNMTITGLVISTPGNMTVSGTSQGAIVNFEVGASTDGFGNDVPATATPPSGSLFPVGTTTVNVTATDTNNQVWSKSFTVTVFPGPSQIQQINPGAGVTPGTVEILSADSIRIVGAGGTTAGGATADLWTGTSDSNTYLSMPWQGDGIFTARLASFTSTDASAKAGLIFRETTTAGSRYSTIHLLRSGSVNFQHKTATNGSTTNTTFFSGSAPGVGIPEWIRMVRQGDTFTLSYSNNGTTWTELSSRSNAMSGSTLSVGFVVAPRTGNTTATATFDNISFFKPIDAWRHTHFGTTFATGNASDSFDADSDGFSNLAEYALGTTPVAAASRPAMPLTITGNGTESFLQITFNRIADPALTYRVEASNTLAAGSWSPVWQSTGTANVPGSVTVTDPLDISSGTPPRRFLRLNITNP